MLISQDEVDTFDFQFVQSYLSLPNLIIAFGQRNIDFVLFLLSYLKVSNCIISATHELDQTFLKT